MCTRKNSKKFKNSNKFSTFNIFFRLRNNNTKTEKYRLCIEMKYSNLLGGLPGVNDRKNRKKSFYLQQLFLF